MKMFLIFSHKLTEEQRKDAIKNLGVEGFVPLPDDLQRLWSQIPPEGDLTTMLYPVIAWLGREAQAGDYVLVQGEFGAVLYIVDFAFCKGLISVYATTRREQEERILDDGSVEMKHVFKHVSFRKYRKFEEG